MNGLLDNLNDMQRAAVENVDGPLLVLAGAGSGKTRVLTYRIAYMIQEKHISPWNILAITFTNKAANEMAARVEELIGPIARDMWVRTFHSACVRILRRDIERIGYSRNFNIIDADDQKTIIKECIKELDLPEKQFQPRAVLAEISAAKDALLTPVQYRESVLKDFRLLQTAKVYELYQKKLERANDLDFDDLIMLTVKLFREAPDVCEYYRGKFSYILVDEYQDTNKAQNELVLMLAKNHGNLCIVGDDDQSIYKFRGADISNILDFEKTFPGASVVRLEQNYRSTQNILDAANGVIENNHGRKGKKLWTDSGKGEKICVYKAESDFDEAAFIADKMQMLFADGYRYSDMAVLYRANASSRCLEEVFMRRALPYRVLAGLRFYDRKEIKDMIAYLRLIKNPSDDVSLRRIINVPPRKIGKVTLDSISMAAQRENCSMLQAIKNNIDKMGRPVREFFEMMEELISLKDTLTIDAVAQAVFEKTGYSEFLKSDEKGDERADNVGELISGAANYTATAPDPNFNDYMDNLALVSDIDNYDEEIDAAVLMTLHAAKGLEFPIVFICGFDEGLFPSSMCIYNPEEIEEERRLCYVGITRARKMLFITSAYRRMVYGKTSPYRPSRFLDEIPKELTSVTDSRENAPSFFVEMPGKNVFPECSLFSKKPPVPKNIGQIFKTGDCVIHKKFGRGIILSAARVGNDVHYEIAFENYGTKNLLGMYAKLTKGE